MIFWNMFVKESCCGRASRLPSNAVPKWEYKTFAPGGDWKSAALTALQNSSDVTSLMVSLPKMVPKRPPMPSTLRTKPEQDRCFDGVWQS